ncbi:MAG: sigma-70 family RNA polymerase sigma factor [Clostridia bacterium]|nr:sigma-70 family RNA polymerase sigma factor [Clostridia bacterium]
MEDKGIIDLFWQRSEKAIEETGKKYQKYCHCIAYNILSSDEDAEECVNDTYLRAWDSIPPQRPDKLSAFLGRITRNLALDRYDARHAQKRSNGIDLAFDELEECLPDHKGEHFTDELALKKAINDFLHSLPQPKRVIFMQRYWYMCAVKDIAKNLKMSENNVKITLMRLREKLKKYLEKEGIDV